MGKVRVLYQSKEGVMTFNGKKPVFNRRKNSVKVPLGLGVILDGTIQDKGTYAFADIRPINSVLPDKYFTIENFKDVGMPVKIYKGTYGNNVFVKEEYMNKVIIKAFDSSGKVIFQEYEKNRGKNGTRLNLNYCKLHNEIRGWEDITEQVLTKVLEKVKMKSCNIDIKNPYILYVLRWLYRNKIVRASNGVVYAYGVYETLVIWEKNNVISMAWLRGKVKETEDMQDITSEVEEQLKANKIIE